MIIIDSDCSNYYYVCQEVDELNYSLDGSLLVSVDIQGDTSCAGKPSASSGSEGEILAFLLCIMWRRCMY